LAFNFGAILSFWHINTFGLLFDTVRVYYSFKTTHMIALFLIFFSYVFYQMLIKPAFELKSASQRKYQNKLEGFFNAANNRRSDYSFAQQKSKTSSYQKPQGFQGGEYIEYEEL
jgi:hypothetical protein